MRITESRLRIIIRSVIKESLIKEAHDSWRDTLPGGRTETYQQGGKFSDPGAALQHDIKRSTDKAYAHYDYDKSKKKSAHDYTSAQSEKFCYENGIDLADAYEITNVYLDSPKKEKFYISDFTQVSKDGKVFLAHYFDLIDDDDSIKRSDLEDLCFNPEKLDIDPNEF